MSFFKRLLIKRSAAPLPAATIPRRNVHFALDESIPRHWYRGWPHVTRFFDGLSIMFPLGEKLFIDSVMHFRPEIQTDVALSNAVHAFVFQEVAHTREHRRYNQLLTTQGAPVDTLEKLLLRRQEVGKRFSPVARLAMTASLEHFTAILSDQLLRNPAVLAGAEPRMAAVWQWHAIEETEHKAVAFDVLCAAVRYPLWRYLLRCAVMLVMTGYFVVDVYYFIYRLVEHDGERRNWREWLRLQWWLWVNPGPVTRILPAWLFWFVPGFHPNRLDSQDVLQTALRAFDNNTEPNP